MLQWFAEHIAEAELESYLEPELPLIQAFYEKDWGLRSTALIIVQHIQDRYYDQKRSHYTYEIIPFDKYPNVFNVSDPTEVMYCAYKKRVL
jgi:hypothetical protein